MRCCRKASRFGCDGMAQLHTEPKLLNFLTALPTIRQQPFGPVVHAKPPRGEQIAFYREFLSAQRAQATTRAGLLPAVQAVKSVTLVSEINCCRTCCDYSIDRFRARFPGKPLEIIELGKVSGQATPYSRVTVTRTP
jgi:alkylhydroperoxidase family enzyme